MQSIENNVILCFNTLPIVNILGENLATNFMEEIENTLLSEVEKIYEEVFPLDKTIVKRSEVMKLKCESEKWFVTEKDFMQKMRNNGYVSIPLVMSKNKIVGSIIVHNTGIETLRQCLEKKGLKYIQHDDNRVLDVETYEKCVLGEWRKRIVLTFNIYDVMESIGMKEYVEAIPRFQHIVFENTQTQDYAPEFEDKIYTYMSKEMAQICDYKGYKIRNCVIPQNMKDDGYTTMTFHGYKGKYETIPPATIIVHMDDLLTLDTYFTRIGMVL